MACGGGIALEKYVGSGPKGWRTDVEVAVLLVSSGKRYSGRLLSNHGWARIPAIVIRSSGSTRSIAIRISLACEGAVEAGRPDT